MVLAHLEVKNMMPRPRSGGERKWPGLCAYCGEPGPDTRDHVIPGSLYPRLSLVERLTVPAHRACNAGFSKDEMSFKEDIATAGANAAAAEARASVLRSFARPQTRRRGLHLLSRFTEGKIFPYRNPAVCRVLKKVMCGLAYWHGLFIALPEERIEVTFARVMPLPRWLQAQAAVFECRDEAVFTLWGFRYVEGHPTLHSYWRLRFFDRVEFDGTIVK